MLLFGLLFMFASVILMFLAFTPLKLSSRPTLKMEPAEMFPGIAAITPPKKKGKFPLFQGIFAKIALLNKPLAIGPLGRRIAKDLAMAKMPMSVEEFLLVKELLVAFFLWVAVSVIGLQSEIFMFAFLMGLVFGYFGPEFWLKGKIRSVKDSIVRDLPDTVDLLGLCVNAGLDFMMALKYVIEKSAQTPIIEELKNMMQEITVGKPRRDALRDMSKRYELPDLSTFARTLIQADRMGTSVTDALNILSEDMREARFRRGETVAMKAPLKMLVPLLLFIFPVVAILVAGPVFLDFFQNNPLQGLGGGK